MKELKNVAAFNELLVQDKPILLDFYADWCGPCQALLPTIEKLADKYEDDFEIVKVNVDVNADLAYEFKVRSIPALFFVQDREVKEKLVGYQSPTVLENKIKQYLVAA